ncbi:MAG: ABC transporter permease subunit [Clostridiales bacterium]|nr:ABC transporter permease subunit [Clostridiales bacterium]
MRVFVYEFRRLATKAVLWLVCVLIVLIMFIKGFYPAFIASRDEVMALLKNFPPDFLTAFGINADSMFTYEGFYVFTFTYMSFLFSVMAASVCVAVFSREKRMKCTDFLLTKPVTRPRIFTEKLLACLSVLAAVNILYIAVIGTDFIRSTANFSFSGSFAALMLAPFLTQLVFTAIGILFTVSAKRVRTVSGVAVSIGIAAFLINSLVSILDKKSLIVFSPLGYFSPEYMNSTGVYDTKLIVAAAVVFVCCMTAAFISYCKRDIAAV